MAAGPIGSAYLYSQEQARQTTQPVTATTVPAYDGIAIPDGVDALQWVNEQWMKNPFSPVFNTRLDYNTYDPATAEYMRGLNDYATSLGVTDYNVLNLYPGVEKIRPSQNAQIRVLPEYDLVKPEPASLPMGMSLPPLTYSPSEYADRLRGAVTAKTPYEQMVEYTLGVPINYGLTGKDVNPYQTFSVRYNTPVALVDQSGKVLASGVGIEAAKRIADQAYDLSRSKKTYTLATGDPNTGQWKPVVIDAPNKSALGQFASFALPVIGGMVAGPLGAAAGSAASGVVQGQGIGDILKNAAIAGVTAAGVGELFQATGLDKAIGSIGGQTASTGVDAATQAAIQAGLEAAPITVVGSQLAPVVSGAVSGLTSAQLSNALSGIADATKPQLPSVIETAVQAPTPVAETPIVVTGQITPRIENAVGAIIGGAGLGDLTRLGYSQAEIDTAIKEAQSRQDTVTATKPPSAIPIVPGIFSSGPPPTMSNQEIADKVLADQKKGGLSTLEKIRLGLLGADLISGLFKPGADNSTYTDKSGPLSYTPLNRQQAVPNFDVFTYGQDLPSAQRGEFLFFPPAGVQTTQPVANTTVPASQKLAKGGEVEDGDMNDDMVKHLMAYRSGGGHRGPGKVKGIGSGQEDLIPAWLSDGEYVWSAQDVADLGDGSTDEGVRRLDKMREMVRKQAGRKNVKKIAKPQKGIESMLKAVGGRV